jgi:hypothetical protein
MFAAGRAMTAVDLFETSSKKGRGMARRSFELIEAMHTAAEAAQPITGRSVGYKLFTQKLIASMATNDMQRIYRLLKVAREHGRIPWDWIVDETRELERVSTWANPAAYARCVARSYRRDFWNQQPVRCEVWSEKGTVRGVLAPVLNEYAVGFRVMHGFSSATSVHDVAKDNDGRDLIALYVGDYDPSGLFMSEQDLPSRLAEYDGHHVDARRIALTRAQIDDLPSFPVTDKRKDPRYEWFVRSYGRRCWELDAMDPNELRDCVEQAIVELIEPAAWQRCETVNRAEQESLRTILEKWGGGKRDPQENLRRRVAAVQAGQREAINHLLSQIGVTDRIGETEAPRDGVARLGAADGKTAQQADALRACERWLKNFFIPLSATMIESGTSSTL